MPKTKPPLESCLGEPISFYNGEVTLRFAADPYHEYYLVGPDGGLTKCNGVTGVSGILDKSHYLKAWAVKVGMEKLLRTMPADTDELGNKLVSPILWSEFEDIVAKSKAAHTEHFDDAGNVGTMAHNWIEDSIRHAIAHTNGKVEKMVGRKPEDERAINCGLAAFDWMQKHTVTWLSTELKVYSREFNYAGTADGVAIMNACTEPKCCPDDYHNLFVLPDWKSSNQLSTEYAYQTIAYLRALLEEFEKTEDQSLLATKIKAALVMSGGRMSRIVLRLGKEDGKFEPWFLPWQTNDEDFEAFKLCLFLKRTHKAIETRISESKKAKTARKRALNARN